MAATSAPQRPPGVNGTTHPDAKEITEYQKILNIRDEIFSGNHPRLKVPQNVIRKITPRAIQTPSTPVPPPSIQQQQRQSAEAIGTTKGQELRAALSSSTGTPLATAVGTAGRSPLAAGGRVSTKPTSEIDPIFLTKSDDLIRAEMQLQRQRLERSLRDQLEQKRLNATQKPPPHESKPDFDVSEVLDKAWEIVKPISAHEVEAANGNIAASDSFDENSFYSSRAPDSPQNEPSQASPVSEKQSRTMDLDNADADVRIDRRSNGAREYEPATCNPAPSQYDVGRRSPVNIPPRPSPPPRIPEPPVAYEEPEYSPPGPDVPMSRPREPVDEGSGLRSTGRGRPDHRASDFEHDTQRVRVVNNHITSPAAPQPSRVSPLAVSRMPSFQGRRGRQDRQADRPLGNSSRRTSPEGPVQQPMSRKRRRVQEQRDRRTIEERRVVESPETPFIKPEPVSPPPFTDVPVSSHDRPRVARGPTVVDVDALPYSPGAERRVYEDHYVDDAGIPRASSRVGYRPLRETRDLRRVASLQNARQEYAQDYAEPEPVPRYTRATSYAVAGPRPPVEREVYCEEPAQPQYTRRYLTRVPSPTSPRYRDEYAEPSRIMGPPPPQRRVVIDADGNRYYESVAPKLAPPPLPPRFTRVEEYDDAVPVRAGTVRAVSVMEHPYGDHRYQQEMPPPPPVTYRRAAPEYARSVAPEPRVYEREPEQRHAPLRSGSVQVVDYPPRRAPYVEDEAYPREVVRMSSVRPPPSRYEEHRELVPRMQSVRPVAREMSVYVHDEPRPHPAYLPAERSSYQVARPVRDERYFEDEEPGHGPEVVRRVSRHY